MDTLKNYSLQENPLTTFIEWYESAIKVEQNAEAMAVSTYDESAKRPNTRYLLFKGVKDHKICFYTNYSSPKSKELDANPEVALVFYWHESKKQVRIHGKVTKMSREDSASYFHSRDRDSQIASYISNQSSPVADKSVLLEKFNAAKIEFENKEIPLPEQWGGFLVEPYEFEFFLYGANRLNDRFSYVLNKNNNWTITRLLP
jgi:pyridoxamine 5'-phosphate oxidase